MKKNLSVIMLAVALMFTVNANAQIKFGLKGGMNVTNMSFDKDVFKASNKTGFFIGPMVKFTLPLVGLSFDAAALYDQKEVDLTYQSKNENVTDRVKMKYVDIPVNVRYGIGLSSLANIFVFAGPQWSYNVGDKMISWGNTKALSLKKSNVSVNVGAGVTLLKHLQVSANYNIACGKKSAEIISFNNGALSDYESDKANSNSWQIALGYYF